MEGAGLPDAWLSDVAAPAICAGIATVAKRSLALDNLEEWPDAWQEAFQDAAIKVWQSATARRLAAGGQWDDLRRFAHRAGSNAAIDLLRQCSSEERRRLLGTDRDDDERLAQLPAHPAAQPEQIVLGEEHRRELCALLDRVQAVLPEVPESPDHPQRTILGLRLHLLEQELRAESAADDRPTGGDTGAAGASALSGALRINPWTGAQPATTEDPLWATWVRLLLGSGNAAPSYREVRLDLQIAGILRPAQAMGSGATDDARRQAAQWVRTEMSRIRRRLRALYERRYGEPLGW